LFKNKSYSFTFLICFSKKIKNMNTIIVNSSIEIMRFLNIDKKYKLKTSMFWLPSIDSCCYFFRTFVTKSTYYDIYFLLFLTEFVQ
jgi:hypothetical protein